MKRKKILVLSVGLFVSAATLIATIVSTCLEFEREERALPPHPSGVDTLALRFVPAIWIVCLLPVVFLELTLLIGAYRLAFYRPKGGAMVCCILAVTLTALSLIFQVLVWTYVLPAQSEPALQDIWLCSLWPVVIVSFILEVIPNRRKKEPPTYEPVI